MKASAYFLACARGWLILVEGWGKEARKSETEGVSPGSSFFAQDVPVHDCDFPCGACSGTR